MLPYARERFEKKAGSIFKHSAVFAGTRECAEQGARERVVTALNVDPVEAGLRGEDGSVDEFVAEAVNLFVGEVSSGRRGG